MPKTHNWIAATVAIAVGLTGGFDVPLTTVTF